MKNTPTNDSIEAGEGKTQIKCYGACQISIRNIHRRIKSNNSADRQLEILTGFGTETLQDGLQVNSFRLVFGGTRGF